MLGEIRDPRVILDLYEHKFRTSVSADANEAEKVDEAIAAIQSRCGFYNYDLYDLYKARSKVPEPDFSPQSGSPTYNIGSVGNLNTGTVRIEGDQIGIQYNSTAESTE